VSPVGFIDSQGTTDENRDEGLIQNFQTPAGIVPYHWSKIQKRWYKASQFHPLMYVPPAPPSWTTRQLLESEPPPFVGLVVPRSTHQSSQFNLRFASIYRLNFWPNPDGLKNYYSRQNTEIPVHFPLQISAIHGFENESDMAYMTRAYIIDPVVLSLHYSGDIRKRLRVLTEDTATSTDPMTGVSIVSRSDLSVCAETQQNYWERFAIIEFKSPGTINYEEWRLAMDQNGAMGPGANTICRQLHKYAWTYNTRFVAVCDGITLVLMRLDGVKDNWIGPNPYQVPPNSASYKYMNDRTSWKCNMFVFLREAFEAKIGY